MDNLFCVFPCSTIWQVVNYSGNLFQNDTRWISIDIDIPGPPRREIKKTKTEFRDSVVSCSDSVLAYPTDSRTLRYA